ncbi:MAG: glycosyltransferase family 87 protein [Candidatus Aminicenantes bacterium]|nr:glycosyltransferase family 87 protein [Candidatus Aminicenantes bacterium]
MRRTRPPAAVLYAVLLAVGLALLWVGKAGLRDFQVNLQAGDRLIHGETLYRTSDEHYQFKYAPFSAVIYAPLAGLPLTVAKSVWLALILGACFLAASWSARLAGLAVPDQPWRAAWPGLILAKYFLRELELGQINALITAVFLGMALLLTAREGRRAPLAEASAGLLAGLGAALKPYGVIMLPYLFLKRRWAALAAAVSFLGLSLLLPAAFYGWKGNWTVHAEWIRTLSRSTPPLLVSQDNVSLLAFFSKWLGPSATATWLYGAAVALLAAAVLFVLIRGDGISRPEPLEVGLLLLAIPLISPLGWEYTYLSAILAISVLLARWSSFSGAFRAVLTADFVLIALSLYDLMRPGLFHFYLGRSLPTLAFLILAAGLLDLRRRRAA